jgi:putative oxidoreductase
VIARLLTPARLLLGLALVLLALDVLWAVYLPFPVGATPLGFELLEALFVSRLIYVALGLMLVAGLALLANRFVPLALAMVMPVLVCMVYWAVVLEGSLGWSGLTLGLAGLAALLMLAHLPAYAAMLQTRALAAGESEADRYERFYAWPVGVTGLRACAMALVPLAGAAAFYQLLVPGLFAFYCCVVLVYPLTVLLLRAAQGLLAKPERGE